MVPGPTAAPRRALLVVNPISGRGRGLAAAEELARGLVRRGCAAEILRTGGRGDAPRLLRAAGPADLVVAVGGDGTLSEVFQGLADPRTPVGLLPCGTGNVLARELGLPRRVPGALEVLLAGRRQEIDVARAGERLAHLVVGVGFDALVIAELEARRKGPITQGVYLGAVVRALRRYRPVPLTVRVDGELLEGTAGAVWVANAGRYAGLLSLAPEARIDDGWLEVYLFPTGRVVELYSSFARGLVSHLPGGKVRMRRARRVRVASAEPVPYQVDGDLAGTTPLEIELLPGRFTLLVP
jgi:YegS/Rv2252/BmrU family lipid kinase